MEGTEGTEKKVDWIRTAVTRVQSLVPALRGLPHQFLSFSVSSVFSVARFFY